MTDQPVAPDVEQVLKSGYRQLYRLLAARITVIAVLVGVPIWLNRSGAEATFFLALPLVAAMVFFVLTVYRIRCGVRLVQCARVLRHYPLEFHTRVVKKSVLHAEYADVYTLRISTRGESGAATMLAINAAGKRRWPGGVENGAWFAGDFPFGGVLVVPGNETLLFLNPEDWEKSAKRRAEAGAERIARAERAGLDKRNWKQPIMWYGG
ncbi:hypothetical protein [Streptomyces flavidovirens]|uniref:hypothetical protein n=1 Tax=Streptomyces flavidovirens TaxID=67298 RepID=UPI000425E5B4|nr:hypothetical protein [Streptomyces flavidovirens]